MSSVNQEHVYSGDYTHVLDHAILVLLTKLRAAERHIEGKELAQRYGELKISLFNSCH